MGYLKCSHTVAACPFIVVKMCFHHGFSEPDQRKVRYYGVNLSGGNCFENNTGLEPL